MTNGPQEPQNGYALTPHIEPSAADTTSDAVSTAHHEELLRTEALAARRGNLAIAKFAAVGLVAALAVGIITWRSSIPSTGNSDSHTVADASANPAMNADPTTVSSPQPSRTPLQSLTPVPENGVGFSGDVVPLSEDPYLPPNAWNGGRHLHPTGTPQSPTETIDDPGPIIPPALTGDTTGNRPVLPTIPGFPGFTISTVEPAEPTESTEPTEQTEQTEPSRRTDRTEATSPRPILSNHQHNTSVTTEPTTG